MASARSWTSAILTARDASKAGGLGGVGSVVAAAAVGEEEKEEEDCELDDDATSANSATRNEWSATDSGCGTPLRTQPVRLVVWYGVGRGQGGRRLCKSEFFFSLLG